MKTINKTMIDHAVKIAREIKANALLVCADVVSDVSLIMDEIEKDIAFIMVSREDESLSEEMKKDAKVLY
ncbi:MAG TPA: hypothetical protein PK424_07205, partial [Smithella sp.]|nr:hypothetical protein [Smithella sp.]